MEPGQERRLLDAARAGDAYAFAALVRGHQLPVRRLCASLLAGRADADDAAQEVFLKAYRFLDSFRGDSAFLTWLYRIASNHCLDLLRAAARRPRESWDALPESERERLAAALRRPDDPAAALEARELVARVLAELPEDYRVALTLRELEGLSYQQIADAMECSLDSVKARLRRARAELERRLEGLA